MNEPITEKEMLDIRKQLDGSKATGLEGIYPAAVKPLAEILVNPFTLLFNASLGEV